MPIDDDILDAYELMAMQRIWAGDTPYLLTFMFHQLTGSADSRNEVMNRELERVYAKLLTHIVRNPTSETGRQQCPLWIVAPDWPVYKGVVRDHLSDIAINDGNHRHAFALIPPRNRLPEAFNLHVARNHAHYVGRDTALSRINVQRIYETPDVALRYTLKSLDRKRVGAGDIFVLPRAVSELSRR